MKYTSFLILFLFFSPVFGLNDVMKVKLSGNNYSDETVVRFLPGATQGFDSQWDAHKFFSLNPNVPQIFTRSNITDLAINALPSLLRDTVVELHMLIPSAGTYTIQGIEAGAFQQGVSVLLEEISSGNLYDLRTGSIFSFTMDTAALNSPVKFIVRFIAPPVITSAGATCLPGLNFIYAEGSLLHINSDLALGQIIDIFDSNGRLVFRQMHATAFPEVDITDYKPGVYLVRIMTATGSFSRRILLQ